MLDPIQHNSHTWRSRYPDVSRRLLALLDPEAHHRVLSFGCSTGEECVDLAALLPKALVVGAEIRALARDTAQRVNAHPRVRYVHPTDAAGEAPFGLIVCHSVLCHHPTPKTPVNQRWSFREFCDVVESLDALLAVGGWLSVVNAEYEFAATPLCKTKYRADKLRRKPEVQVFDEHNTVTTRGRKPLPVLFQKAHP